MSIFKRKQRIDIDDKVCGFLDINEKFFRNEQDRNYSNYRIMSEGLREKLEHNIKDVIRNWQTGGVTYEQHTKIDALVKALDTFGERDFATLVGVYINYTEAIKELEKN